MDLVLDDEMALRNGVSTTASIHNGSASSRLIRASSISAPPHGGLQSKCHNILMFV